MVRDVVRVIIREESGFLSEPSEAYAERLQVDRRSVSYEYRPRSESERNPGRKWTSRTDSPAFALIFDELASAAAVALREPREPMCCDIGPTTLSVTYDDRTRESKTFFGSMGSLADPLGLVRKAIPPLEDMPRMLDW